MSNENRLDCYSEKVSKNLMEISRFESDRANAYIGTNDGKNGMDHPPPWSPYVDKLPRAVGGLSEVPGTPPPFP